MEQINHVCCWCNFKWRWFTLTNGTSGGGGGGARHVLINLPSIVFQVYCSAFYSPCVSWCSFTFSLPDHPSLFFTLAPHPCYLTSPYTVFFPSPFYSAPLLIWEVKSNKSKSMQRINVHRGSEGDESGRGKRREKAISLFLSVPFLWLVHFDVLRLSMLLFLLLFLLCSFPLLSYFAFHRFS